MWCLSNKDGKHYYLRPDHQNIVGRNTGDIVLSNDKSISRKHASVYSSDETITVEDFGSTYGTYINENISIQKKIEANTKVSLKDKDIIKFGLLENEWVVSKLSFVTCTSTMNVQDKKNVEAILKKIGLNMCSDVDSTCTHLTMSVITLTIKVVMALVSLKPIVTPAFWSECLNCYNSHRALPDHKEYLPAIKESTLNEQTVNCQVNVDRKDLFSGKTFIFFSRKQKNLYQKIIEAAAGCCFLLSECPMKKSQLCQNNYIVIQYILNKNSQDSQVQQSIIDGIVDYIHGKNLRVIPETEIGLSILFCSLEKYCNPSFSFLTVVKKSSVVEQIEKNYVVLAPETQSFTDSECLSLCPPSGKQINETASSISSTHGRIVPASLSLTDDVVKNEFTDRKTRRSTSPFSSEERPRKKIALDKTQPDEPSSSELFQFVNERNGTAEMATTGSKLSNLTFKSRKPREVVCNNDDLFNFLPNVDEDNAKLKHRKTTTLDTFSFGCRSSTSSSTTDSTLKRKHDGPDSDFPDGKRIMKNIAGPSVVSNSRKLNMDNIPWISTKSVKKEKSFENDTASDAFSTSDIESKLRDLDMRPAVVLVNETLLKRDTSKTSQTNFKRFVKVQPLKTQNKVIPRSEFCIYEGMVRKAIADMDKDSSDEADNGDDQFMSFNKTKPKPVSKRENNGRARRL